MVVTKDNSVNLWHQDLIGREQNKTEITYQKRLTNGSWKVGVDYAAQIHWFGFPPIVAVNCDIGKAMGKEKWCRTRFDKSTKNDNIECG